MMAPFSGPSTHTHGAVDPALLASRQGLRTVRWSFLALMGTSVFQGVIVAFSGSIALLADTIHNLGDAATAFPLWIAFRLSFRKPSKRFTYGLGRVEDLAAILVVALILVSAIAALQQSLEGFFHPREVQYLWAVGLASLVGFAGNEAVAAFRIRTGKEIGSEALIADGYHARADGYTSLAVLMGVLGIRLGYPLADPIVGLLITGVILRIVWKTGKRVFIRLLDGVDPEVVEEIIHTASQTPGVRGISEVRVRWLGHRLHSEVNVEVEPRISVERAHDIAKEVRHRLLHQLRYLSTATIHIDPGGVGGEAHHRMAAHDE